MNNKNLDFNFISINNVLDYQEENRTASETTTSTLEQTNISIGANLESQWHADF